EMRLQQVAGFNGLFVATVNQYHTVALEYNAGGVGPGLGQGREQRRHLRAGCGRLRGPARSLAKIDEIEGRRTSDVSCGGGEHCSLLRAAHRQRGRVLRDGLKTLEFRSTELMRCCGHMGTVAAASHPLWVDPHRSLAAAEQDITGGVSHFPTITRRIGGGYCTRALSIRAHMGL